MQLQLSAVSIASIRTTIFQPPKPENHEKSMLFRHPPYTRSSQEESRSISENVTWGVRKRFADKKVSLPYKRFLGYEKGPDGLPTVVEDEADIVRLIYRLFLFGKSPNFIASLLTDSGFPSPGGKVKWGANVIVSILTNEKIQGMARLQKKYTVDFLAKRQKVNKGEVQMYMVTDSHPAIIEPEIWDLAQVEMKHRKSIGRWSSSAHPFSGKIFCGDSNHLFGEQYL